MSLGELMSGAVAYVVAYWRVLAKALAVPFVLALALDFAVLKSEIGSHPSEFYGYLIADALINLFLVTLFAVPVHRTVLLGREARGVVPTWSRRETNFLLRSLGLVALCLLVFALAFVPIYGSIIGLILVIFVLPRMSLVLPGAAVDNPISYLESWRLTENDKWLMMKAVIVVPVIINIPAILLEQIPQYGMYLSLPVSIMSFVITIAALSIAYKEIVQHPYAAPNNALERPD